MDLIQDYSSVLRAAFELMLIGFCGQLWINYRAACRETLLISQAGRSFLKGLPVSAVSKIKSAEVRSLIRLLQVASNHAKREKLRSPPEVDIELNVHGNLEQLGEALIRAVSNQVVIRPKASRIFLKRAGKLTLLSQQGLVSGRFGRIIFEILEDHHTTSETGNSLKADNSLNCYGICQYFCSKFSLPDNQDDELILWLGFDEFFSTSFKDQRQAFESLIRNLSIIISQFRKIARLEKAIGDERDAFLGISHDLKAPGITALYLIRELQTKLPESSVNQAVYSDLEILMLEQLSLIRDYLDIERERTTSIPTTLESFEIERFVSDILDSPIVRHDKNKLKFETSILACGKVTFDKNHLKRIVLNLISNSLKYCQNGKITLGVAPVGEREIRLFVADTGRGIPPELAEKLFLNFQRLDAPATISGSGIGLAASQLLAECNGSKLQYESPSEGGSIFSLALSRSTEAPCVASKVSGETNRNDKTVLVIEDDEATCRLYKRVLNAIGYDIECQSSVKDAWSSLLSKRQFVALIADVKLPDGDSFTLLKEMSQKGLSLPTIVISGMAEWSGYYRQLKEVLERVSSVKFLEKPIEREDLERAFNELMTKDISAALELNLRG